MAKTNKSSPVQVQRKILKAAERLGQYFSEEARSKRDHAEMMTPKTDPNGQLAEQLNREAERLHAISIAMFQLDALKKGKLRYDRPVTYAKTKVNANPEGKVPDAACTETPAQGVKGLNAASPFTSAVVNSRILAAGVDCGRAELNPVRQLFGIIAQHTSRLLQRKENRIIFEGAQNVVNNKEGFARPNPWMYPESAAPQSPGKHKPAAQARPQPQPRGDRPSSIPPPPN